MTTPNAGELLAQLIEARAPSAPLEGTAGAAKAIDRVSYTHDAMIDLMIANPAISKTAIARHFGYTNAWVSQITNSDAFLARLAERKKDVVDPSLILTVDEKLKALAQRSLDVLQEKLETVPTFDAALAAATLTTKALGYGARPQNTMIAQQFVVALPPKAASEGAWLEKAKSEIVDVQAKQVGGGE